MYILAPVIEIHRALCYNTGKGKRMPTKPSVYL